MLFLGTAGDSPRELISFGDDWIESLAVHEAAGHIGLASGQEVRVIDGHGRAAADFAPLSSTVSGIAFDAAGQRIAASRYNGVTVLNLDSGKVELTLDWKGSHIGVSWSPDGRYLVTATQEKELHIWDLVTMKDFRMGGYPRK
ncbi:MAG: WD40 repeat domain-containing protein, partial [Rhodomicrobium sp.]|nr:WD40 repeat domain-containing protein [Rhodomicrobium sp.]